jgi:hypothetical protein
VNVTSGLQAVKAKAVRWVDPLVAVASVQIDSDPTGPNYGLVACNETPALAHTRIVPSLAVFFGKPASYISICPFPGATERPTTERAEASICATMMDRHEAEHLGFAICGYFFCLIHQARSRMETPTTYFADQDGRKRLCSNAAGADTPALLYKAGVKR